MTIHWLLCDSRGIVSRKDRWLWVWNEMSHGHPRGSRDLNPILIADMRPLLYWFVGESWALMGGIWLGVLLSCRWLLFVVVVSSRVEIIGWIIGMWDGMSHI